VSLNKNAASLVGPTVPSQTDEPHAVVIAGQKFQFEWVTGHNMDTYIILVAKKDADKLKNHEVPMMEAFLKDAACPQGPPAAMWLNYHYKFNETSLSFFPPKDKDVQPPTIDNFYKRRTLPADAHFIPRSAAFQKTMKNMRAPAGPKASAVQQFEYKDADVATNRRCVPNNPIAKYPWVIAMHKYRHVRHQPTEPDVAWLQFPADTPPGDYIVHYRWRSYYDAMDVRVIAGTTPVADVFGGGAGGAPTGAPVARFKRVDHCSFFNATLSAGGSCIKMSVAAGKLAVPQACLDACKAMSIDKCDGVAVVPLVNDPSVAPAFKNLIKIPFRAGSCVNPTDASTHMCFPVLQADVTQTQNSFVITSDTEDPAFYSTCFRRSDAVRRDGLPDPATLPFIAADVPDWKANSRCISCDDQTKFSKADVTPVWVLATSCVNCDANK
jgi:hypothetical protein